MNIEDVLPKPNTTCLAVPIVLRLWRAPLSSNRTLSTENSFNISMMNRTLLAKRTPLLAKWQMLSPVLTLMADRNSLTSVVTKAPSG